MQRSIRRVLLAGITALLLASLGGIPALAMNLATPEVAGGCSGACCPGSGEGEAPTDYCAVGECPCPSCLSAELPSYALPLPSSAAAEILAQPAVCRLPAAHPALIDYPPEAVA